MRKIFFIFPAYFLLLSGLFSLFTPTPAFAIICQVTTSPSPVTTADKTIDIKIHAPGLLEEKDYLVAFTQGPSPDYFAESINNRLVSKKSRIDNNNVITINNVGFNGLIKPEYNKTFEQKTYRVNIIDPSPPGTKYCDSPGQFTVQQARAGGKDSCAIEFLNERFTPRDDLNYRLANLTTNDENLKTILRRRGGPANGQEVKSSVGQSSFENPVGDLKDKGGVILGKLEEGGYYLEVAHPGGILGIGQKTLCFTTFDICSTCTRQQVAAGTGTLFDKPLPPCATELTKEGCPVVNTAVGNIETSPAKLVGFLFKLILGLSGGIALILIIVGAYQMMTSQGNPERLQGAKETITSAVVGLLFIIFSFLLLEIIGVDILRIPGLSR